MQPVPRADSAACRGAGGTEGLRQAQGGEESRQEGREETGAQARKEGCEEAQPQVTDSAAARAAGESYGWAFRRARLDPSIPSTLDVRPGGGFPGAPPLEQVLAHGEGTALARRKLAEFRARLSRQADLVAACDLVCGEEKTPREAAADEREAVRLEAVLKVALDILAGEQGA